MTIDVGAAPAAQESRQSLSTAAARNLATTTKTVPQMQGITSRWLLRQLPWVPVSGGTYRVNRRLTHAAGRGRVAFVQTGADVKVLAPTLREIPAFAAIEDEGVLAELAGRFTRHAFEAGQVLVVGASPIDQVLLVVHGRVDELAGAKYGGQSLARGYADGDHIGDEVLTRSDATWSGTLRGVTSGVLLALPVASFRELSVRSDPLRASLDAHRTRGAKPVNRKGEAEIALAAGHSGEPDLPSTFADYELAPREYGLSVAQTVLRVHSRVADLYNDPMNQVEQQLRLTVEALRERQENEVVNNPEFGLLANADYGQRISTRSGPPTPDDFDDLLSMRRSTRVLFAHPKVIAAFGRECTRRGIYPQAVDLDGHGVAGWRGVPLLPCDKIPITGGNTSTVLALRTGEQDQGVVGLAPTALPDEVEPGLNVRFMGIDTTAIMSYLVSTYYSAAVLVPDALGLLENVELGR
ncbi:cyclic nucleotide-binding domain-containing protein [Actinospica durhamensis]|uniref:Cyclic nucleotide-binding domain-containing protein n=1 Tax=Actinospica durhamensis TaxID=1508375 RepID=A0A941IUM4_9ACTN|nr:family 2B encapsulin nanocompartment shell protein [Actinospica durhamensis]MBR7837718.1 cyclic nucleotide-binding domain-containing protein [Actinospica durhamensis]